MNPTNPTNSTNSKDVVNWCVLALASGLFLSHPLAKLRSGSKFTGAGLVGTLWGVVIWPFVPVNTLLLVAVLTGVTIVSMIISQRAEIIYGSHDDARIVIDETVGVMIALAFIPRSFVWISAAFVLFRFCDVLKFPWGRACARLPGGIGIVADDIVAGITANILLQGVRMLIGT